MRILLSPAKKMREVPELCIPEGVPVFKEETEELLDYLKNLSFAEAKALWKCNDKIAEENFKRFSDMNPWGGETAALIAYDGIAFQYLSPKVLERDGYTWLQDHLRILSAFYGVVRPLDAVVPYRLEMQAKAAVSGKKNLYDFWGEKLYREIRDESGIFLNLASKEYSKCVENYLQPEDTFLNVTFGELENGKIVQKSVYAKMARGEAVRFLAERGSACAEDLKVFDRLGYSYSETHSKPGEYVFLK